MFVDAMIFYANELPVQNSKESIQFEVRKGHKEYSLWKPLFTDKGNEGAAIEADGRNSGISFPHENQVLQLTVTDWENHSSAKIELFYQRGRNLWCSRRHSNGIVRRSRRIAQCAVAHDDLDISVSQIVEMLPC